VNFIDEGLKWFFRTFLGQTLDEIGSVLKYKWECKTGIRQVFEYSDFNDLAQGLYRNEIEGIADIKIENVCLSNFAPIYLCYPGQNYASLNAWIRNEAKQARTLYDFLKERDEIKDDSLFMRAIKGRAKIDTLFREYVEDKKFRFLNFSLARFAPLTQRICYSAIFESGKELKQHTAPLETDAHLEPYVPLFYDTTLPRGVEHLSYIDVEVYGKVMPLPIMWAELLRKRGIQIEHSPYCIYVPCSKPYYIDIKGLQTFMSLDSWIVFSVPELNLELPWYCRFDPNSEQSRQVVTETFTGIYQELLSNKSTNILFYSDYVQPFVRNISPIFNRRTIKKLLS